MTPLVLMALLQLGDLVTTRAALVAGDDDATEHGLLVSGSLYQLIALKLLCLVLFAALVARSRRRAWFLCAFYAAVVISNCCWLLGGAR